MTNEEIIDEIDYLISVIGPGKMRKLEHKLALEKIKINPFERSKEVLRQLHAKRDELIDCST